MNSLWTEPVPANQCTFTGVSVKRRLEFASKRAIEREVKFVSTEHFNFSIDQRDRKNKDLREWIASAIQRKKHPIWPTRLLCPECHQRNEQKNEKRSDTQRFKQCSVCSQFCVPQDESVDLSCTWRRRDVSRETMCVKLSTLKLTKALWKLGTWQIDAPKGRHLKYGLQSLQIQIAGGKVDGS